MAAQELKLFYAGLRGGFSSSSYTVNTRYWGSGARDAVSVSGEFAVQLSLQVFRAFAVQTEAVFMEESFEIRGPYPASLSSAVMTLPILGKITFRPGPLLLAGFAGVCFTLPLKEMSLSVAERAYTYNYTVPPGFVLGGNAGIKLGPGTLFVDIRYSGAFGETELTGDWGSRAVYKRDLVSYSIGYELGFGGRKGK
jgi:hypothetical protein